MQNKSGQRYATPSGHALSETGAIVAIISLACVVAMTTLQADMDSLLASIRGGVDNRGSVALANTANPNTSKQTSNTLSADPLLSESNRDFSSAFSSEASNIYNSVISNVETTGANGATEMLAITLRQSAEQMLASGSIDQKTANQLIALSDQAFRIAQIQKIVEDAIKAGRSNQPVTFDGITYSNTDELIITAGAMQYKNAPPTWEERINDRFDAMSKFGTPAFDQTGWTIGPELANFWSQYTVIARNPEFKKSPAADQVTAAANAIFYLADAVESSMDTRSTSDMNYFKNQTLAYYDATLKVTSTITINQLDHSKNISENTQDQAKKVCKGGQGKIVNNDCQ